MSIRTITIHIKPYAIFSRPVLYAVSTVCFAIAAGSAKGLWIWPAIFGVAYAAACFVNSIARIVASIDEAATKGDRNE